MTVERDVVFSKKEMERIREAARGLGTSYVEFAKWAILEAVNEWEGYEHEAERTIRRELISRIDTNGPIPVKRPDLGPCWIWTGNRYPTGYGRFGQRMAHNVIYESLLGPTPDGLEPDHLCRNPICVKVVADPRGPAHLEFVTHRENIRRAFEDRTHCPHGHPYDEENTYFSPSGHRHCRTCNRERVNRTRREA